jgi:hypothetical protein
VDRAGVDAPAPLLFATLAGTGDAIAVLTSDGAHPCFDIGTDCRWAGRNDFRFAMLEVEQQDAQYTHSVCKMSHRCTCK